MSREENAGLTIAEPGNSILADGFGLEIVGLGNRVVVGCQIPPLFHKMGSGRRKYRLKGGHRLDNMFLVVQEVT